MVHFDKLVADFLSINKNINTPVEFDEMNDETHRRQFLLRDEEFKKLWINYHNDNAILRILCQRCNLGRKKYKPPSA